MTVNGLNVTQPELYKTSRFVVSENAGLPENEILKRIGLAAEEI
ncbi:MAG: hypothetical protein ACI4JD_03590 [Ruminococcus sp.]